MIGRTVLHYSILEKLGEGGMGVVYLAEDTKLKRQVAIKFLPQQLAASEEERERFKIEAQAAAALNHSNITQIYAIEEADDELFIVMEYIDGAELKTIVEAHRNTPLPLDRISDYAVQIASALNTAHNKGIVHRDIKTSNIMITDDGQLKIMDFGLAKLSGTSDFTKTSSTLGTTAYMSPEQIRGEVVDNRSDIWSFGVVLFEMLTGEHPFKGDYEATIIYEILNEQPQDITKIRQDLPQNMVHLLSELLDKDCDQRVQDASEIIKKLVDKPQETISNTHNNSIAVLYFENMSPDKDNDYFCAGMTEDIIIDLSKIHDIRVVPRSDVLAFSDKQVNSRKAGEILNVAYILEGSVRKAGKQLRITAQLIDVRTGFQVWAERYDRMMEDVFEIQMEVAEKITGAMKISLTDSEKESLAQKPTEDLRAYDFYLRGREFLLAHGENNNNNAIKMFELAKSIDPNYALVYVGLAEAYAQKYWAYDGDVQWIDKMKEVNKKALELESDLIEAQLGKGLIAHFQEKFDQARDIFDAISKQKNDFYPALLWSGVVSQIQKDYEGALVKLKEAAELKTYSEEPWLHIAHCYKHLGDEESNRKAEDRLLENVQKKLEANANDAIALSRMAATYGKRGQEDKALKIVEKLLELAPTDGLIMYNCACTYSLLSLKDKALKLLDTALDKGYKNIISWVDQDRDFDAIRESDDFKDLIKKYI
jgi:non-specific serine/threonine protein kinase